MIKITLTNIFQKLVEYSQLKDYHWLGPPLLGKHFNKYCQEGEGIAISAHKRMTFRCGDVSLSDSRDGVSLQYISYLKSVIKLPNC